MNWAKLFQAIPALLKAIKAGEELKNAGAWKVGQNLTNTIYLVLVGLVAAAKAFNFDLGLSDDKLLELAGYITGLVGIANVYITTASSKKIGTN